MWKASRVEWSEAVMLLVIAVVLSAMTCVALVTVPMAGITLLFIVKPVVDATWRDLLVAGMPLTQIVAGLVPVIVLGHMLTASKDAQLIRMPLWPLWVIYTVALSLSVVQIIHGQDMRTGFSVLLRHMNGLVGFYMVQAFFRREREIKIFLTMLIVAGLFPVGMGLYQLATGVVWQGEAQQIEGIVRNVGLYHDAITIRQYALQTILSIFLYLALFPPKRMTGTASLWAFAALSVVVASKAYSKAGLMILGLWALSWTLLRRKVVVLIALLSIGAVVGAYVASNYMGEVLRIYQKELGFLSGTVAADRTFNGRWYLWQEMLTEWGKLGAVAKVFGSGREALGAHNDYLQILFHGGLVGLVLYLTLLVSIGIMLIRNLIRRVDPLAVAGFMVFLAWMVDTIGLVPSAYSGYQWFVWGLIGLSLRVRQEEERRGVPLGDPFEPSSAIVESALSALPVRRFPLVSG